MSNELKSALSIHIDALTAFNGIAKSIRDKKTIKKKQNQNTVTSINVQRNVNEQIKA